MLLTFHFCFSPSCLHPSTSLLKFTLASEQILSMKGQEGVTPLAYLLKIWRSNNHCAHKSCGWFRAYTSSLSLPPSDSLGSQRKRKTELIKGRAVIKWKWAKMKGLPSTSKVQQRLGELTAGVPGSEVQTAEEWTRHSWSSCVPATQRPRTNKLRGFPPECTERWVTQSIKGQTPFPHFQKWKFKNVVQFTDCCSWWCLWNSAFTLTESFSVGPAGV